MTFNMPEPVVLTTEYDERNVYGYTADQLRAAYEQGLGDAALVCCVHAEGWRANPGINPYAGFVALSNCSEDIRKLKEQANDNS